MKRFFIIVCLFALLLTGCSSSNGNIKNNVSGIDQYSWQMTSVQSMEAEGRAIFYGPNGSSTLDTAVEILLSCTARDGELSLEDATNGQTYSGSYKLSETSQESIIYEVVLGETEGMAVVAMTTYDDNRQTPTLIIRLGDYALHFQSFD